MTIDSVIVSSLTVNYPIVNANKRQFSRISKQGKVGNSGQILLSNKPIIKAIDNISFNINEGGSVALLGPNGSGKSTLLRVLAGIMPINDGSIKTIHEPFGILNIKQGLQLEASGRRNILIRGLILGKKPREINERIEDIAEFSGLGDYLELPVSTYSSGMVMRLVFSVLAIFKPKILLLDEWIGAVDQEFQDSAIEWLVDYSNSYGTLILASHNAGLIRKCCSSGLLLKNGRLVLQDDLESVIKKYRKIRHEK